MSRVLRIIIGLGLVGYGAYSGIAWFYLGILPLISGVMNWCFINKLFKKSEPKSCCSISDEQIQAYAKDKNENSCGCEKS